MTMNLGPTDYDQQLFDERDRSQISTVSLSTFLHFATTSPSIRDPASADVLSSHQNQVFLESKGFYNDYLKTVFGTAIGASEQAYLSHYYL